MREVSIGEMKEITDEYYRLIGSRLKRRTILRSLERKFNVSRKQLVDIIDGWEE